jgi:hypothetical protein
MLSMFVGHSMLYAAGFIGVVTAIIGLSILLR